ncbi:MAG: SGNH/GDSL hydrolase family protein [Mycobacteriaceae bacterium]|nr:SGNH/GDSL hydrolase family protein [Mycobacteriaceae bacterium]
MAAISRYIALGDSFTEGIGDPHPPSANGLRGWADLVAAQLAGNRPAFRYANLAVRGRTMRDVIDDQVDAAIALEPDFVTVYAGMNDLLRIRTDIDTMMAGYADALARLQRAGARVLTFTAADIGTVPVFRRLRGRAAIYNELLRAIVDDLGLELVDFWRMSEFRDQRMWDDDRIHLSPHGHRRIAVRVLDKLGVAHELTCPDDAQMSGDRSFRADLYWAATFAAPWAFRRLRRLTPGAGVEPKLASLTAVF